MSNYCQKGHWENGMKLPCKQCEIESLQSRIDELESQLAGKWCPIETAPKDGTRVLLCIDHGEWGDKVWTGMWAAGWMISYGKARTEPTHWMQLPTPPSEGGK